MREKSQARTAAIKPSKEGELKTVAVNNERCMFCGNCYTMCPAMPLANADGDGIALWVGGKVSNSRCAPKFSKLAVPVCRALAPAYGRGTVPRATVTTNAPRDLSAWTSRST